MRNDTGWIQDLWGLFRLLFLVFGTVFALGFWVGRCTA